jgi:RNA polymerase sigma factor (sigma-70 family)
MIAGTQQDILLELRQPDIEKPVRQLYELYFESIVIQICANGGNREDGADIFQDAVLVLIEKVKTGQFRGDSSIKTFLSAIARNLWLFELRTRERRKNREGLYMNGEDKETANEDVFFNKQINVDLLAVLNEIGDTCKKILTGFYYEDKSMKELLGSFDYENEQVLRNRKSRCMKKLKQLIENNTTLLQNLKPISIYES